MNRARLDRPTGDKALLEEWCLQFIWWLKLLDESKQDSSHPKALTLSRLSIERDFDIGISKPSKPFLYKQKKIVRKKWHADRKHSC